MVYLHESLEGAVDSDNLFLSVAALEGEVFRQVASRRTIRFEYGGAGFFAKIHYGSGWGEIFKNLVLLRLPVLGAKNEWQALAKLKSLDIDSMQPVAYVSEGWNPAKIHSCIVTRELAGTESLEELCARGGLSLDLKRRLIPKIAAISRRLHENGVNHRDYYLCHFLLDQQAAMQDDPVLYLIDLHRVQLRRRTPRRWVVKDIGGLFFSAFDINFTKNDMLRFMKTYSGKSLRQTLAEDHVFWRQVLKRAARLYRQDKETLPDWIAMLEISL